VIADEYKINFYGEVTSSFLHQIGTDRLWVTWLIDSQRVRDRLQTNEVKSIAPDDVAALVRVSSGCEPDTSRSSDLIGSQSLSIEIPWNINDIQRDQPELAANWRAATRAAFTSAINADYLVSDFNRATRNDRSVGVYLLTLREQFE
jgi:predicted GNAT superfamily acetyltransferase